MEALELVKHIRAPKQGVSKFSGGENETLSCQAQETGGNRERKQRPAGKIATKITCALIKHHKCFI